MGNVSSKTEAQTQTLAPPSPPPRASLLGLPPELRLMVYDIVKDFDLQHHLTIRSERLLSPHLPPRLPLRDLAKSCKLIAQEIRHHRHCLPTSERYAVILSQISREGFELRLTRAPCPAKEVTTLRFMYDFAVSTRPVGDLSPGIITVPVFDPFGNNTIHIPSITDGLPATLTVQVFCHMRLDSSHPPSKVLYEGLVRSTRDFLNAFYVSRSARSSKAPVLRLVDFTVDVWKPLAIADQVGERKHTHDMRGLRKLLAVVRKAICC